MLLGAHISTAGGLRNAPARASAIEATAVQIFTKQPNRWADPELKPDDADLFRTGIAGGAVAFTCAHDSYLINLATPDAQLRDRSYASFRAELRRAAELGLDAVVTHPGNATDGDRARGLAQNAALIEQALEEVPGPVRVLIEITAGSGNALGCTFEELGEIIDRTGKPARDRIGICFDTCHAFAAGYDIAADYHGVIDRLLAAMDIDRVQLFHLNDSLHPLGSRKDRHAEIGEGVLGDEPFRSIMNDPRFAGIPKVIETPKGDDHETADRRNLGRLRRLCG